VWVSADGKTTTATAQIPLGFRVADPVTLKADDKADVKLTVQTCRPDGCFAEGTVGDAVLKALREGKQLALSFQSLDRQTATLNVPLDGFAAAYAKLK